MQHFRRIIVVKQDKYQLTFTWSVIDVLWIWKLFKWQHLNNAMQMVTKHYDWSSPLFFYSGSLTDPFMSTDPLSPNFFSVITSQFQLQHKAPHCWTVTASHWLGIHWQNECLSYNVWIWLHRLREASTKCHTLSLCSFPPFCLSHKKTLIDPLLR